uniref:Uncharacterized protein n=1 Tax=Tanacetum cinerariifolium TaxID=118510 RepID=A0A6L2JI55_TANCI|nr:hypothetical protein [Tanacetum cinerariifolium]
MSNNLQTSATSSHHYAIMEVGGKDRPPMLAPDIVVLATPSIADAPPTRKSIVKETYATVSEEIRKKIVAEAEAVHIIHIRINNDIYSTVDACPNAKKM